MASVLESVEWGKNALEFLNLIKMIDDDKPAIIYLRHSKADYSQVKSPKDGTLTEEGIQTSIEFGTKLPSEHRYRIFHSNYPRARITAEKIHRGLLNQNVESTIMGVQKNLIFSKSDEQKIMQLREVYDTEFTTHWISGRFNETEVESSLELAKENARKIIKNLKEIEAGSFDVYLTHDVTIIPLMFHWFGVFHNFPWPGHLEGFILQLYEEKMVYIDKEGKHELDYPHWWTMR